jgi:tetratricopeptide (TPR) repeat protein
MEWSAACLDRAREGSKALVDALIEVDASRLDRVVGGFPPSLAACSRVAPDAPELPPSDPALQAKIDEVQRGIAVTRALISGARGPESIELATRTLELARDSGHLPSIAAASAQLGRAGWAAARTAEERAAAEARLRESLKLAADAGDIPLLARTSSYLFAIIAYGQHRIQDAEAMLPTVEAVITRAGNEPEQRVELLMGKGSILGQHLKLSEALEAFDEVVRLAPSVEGEIRIYGSYAAGEQGAIYTELGDHAAAAAAQRRLLDGVRATYGAYHPRNLIALANLARAESRGGRRDAAMQVVAEMRRLAAETPPEEPRLHQVPLAEADVWRNLGEPARAVAFFREALAGMTVANGPDHPRTTEVLLRLGSCLAEADQVPEAVAHLERALRNRRNRAETPTSIGEAAFALAKVLWMQPSQRARAVELIDEAQTLWKKDGAHEADAEAWIAERREALNQVRSVR